ncbi:MAG: M67 family metallopeptidase [Limnothrix sp. RL_2_0]|nr:M67 family metallopeptidase [Limnothrix sp. RL_2_0]
MLKIAEDLLTICHNHARRCYPEECCGLLLGNDKQVIKIWPTQNSWTEDFGDRLPINPSTTKALSRLNRFAIDPKEMLAAQKFARTQGCNILGIYHSHPDHPAIPSESDRAIAWDLYSYLIMSVTPEKVAATRSWILTGDRQFIEEEIILILTKSPEPKVESLE